MSDLIDEFMEALRAKGLDPSDIYISESAGEAHLRRHVTRALTAQAWAVAIALFGDPLGPDGFLTKEDLDECEVGGVTWGIRLCVRDVMALPAPADLAAALMGDP